MFKMAHFIRGPQGSLAIGQANTLTGPPLADIMGAVLQCYLMMLGFFIAKTEMQKIKFLLWSCSQIKLKILQIKILLYKSFLNYFQFSYISHLPYLLHRDRYERWMDNLINTYKAWINTCNFFTSLLSSTLS